MATNKYDVVIAIYKGKEDIGVRRKMINEFLQMEMYNPIPTPTESSLYKEKSITTNLIKFEGDIIKIIDEGNDKQIKIDVSNPEETVDVLNQLCDEQLEALLKLGIDKKLSGLFKTLVDGVVSNKNIIKGNISNVEQLKVGDTYKFHYYKIIKKDVTVLTNININI